MPVALCVRAASACGRAESERGQAGMVCSRTACVGGRCGLHRHQALAGALPRQAGMWLGFSDREQWLKWLHTPGAWGVGCTSGGDPPAVQSCVLCQQRNKMLAAAACGCVVQMQFHISFLGCLFAACCCGVVWYVCVFFAAHWWGGVLCAFPTDRLAAAAQGVCACVVLTALECGTAYAPVSVKCCVVSSPLLLKPTPLYVVAHCCCAGGAALLRLCWCWGAAWINPRLLGSAALHPLHSSPPDVGACRRRCC